MIMAITSKCVKNEKVAHEVQSNESLMFLPHFSTATWYLFVLYDRGAKTVSVDAIYAFVF